MKRARKSYFHKAKQSSGNNQERAFKLATRILLFGVSLLGLALIMQIMRWQIFEHDKYLAIAQSQYHDSQRQASGRGIILATDGTVLATDQPAWDIFASLSSYERERVDFFAEKDRFVAEVASVLQIEKKEISEQLTDEFRYVKLADNASPEQKKALETLQIFQATKTGLNDTQIFKRGPGFGLYFVKSEKRTYPDGTLASHILGFMGKDENGQDRGLYGIEGYYFGDLSGSESYTYEAKDAQGNVILTSEYDPVLPRSGKDIRLTISAPIQSKTEKILKNGVERYQAKSGSVIIMDPGTGAIIAMANYPDYNPNEYWRVQDPWIYKNRAIGDVYEPGSIFKPITVAIALETKSITPETVCHDNDGYIKIFEGTIDEKTIYTWDKNPDGDIIPREYLQYSNNPCIVETALATGHEKFYPKLKEFGIGDFIGIGLQDEANAYLLPYEYWTKLDLAVSAFGQSLSTTPLQMISAMSAIANDGKRMRPYIVQEVIEGEEVIKYEPDILSQPLSKETANLVADMMRSVPLAGDGSAYFKKYLPGYDVAGKTGTAQIPKRTEVGYYADRTNASFIGFAPADNPQMIMIVRLEEPGTDIYAANTAVPLWIELFMNLVDDLEVPKTR